MSVHMLRHIPGGGGPRWPRAVLLGTMLGLAACAGPTQIITGTPRPAIPVADVKIYPAMPPQGQEIAQLNASSHSAFGTGGQKSIDKVVNELKDKAAKLGANGIVLEGFSDKQTGSIGTGVGSESYGRSSAVGVGASGGFGIYKKTGQAKAIYVPVSD